MVGVMSLSASTMDISPQDLVDYLLAPAGAIPADQSGIFLLTQTKDGLIEKIFTGAELADQYRVTRSVKERTPALYLLDGEKRYLFAVDTKNTLRRYKFDADEEEWTERSKDSPDLPPLPNVCASSHLSGSIIPEGQIIFFEGPDGQLQAINISSSGKYQHLSSISPQPRQSAHHSAFASSDGLLHLLYIHQDNQVHHWTRGSDGDTDTALTGSELENDQVDKFLAIPYLDEALSFGMCVLSSAGKLILIDKEGTKTVLGNVSGGQFVAASSEECVIEMIGLIKKGIQYASGKVCARGKK